MRDEHRRPLPHQRLVGVDHPPLGDRVERRGRLVEHQHTRVGEQRAGDGDPLPLARRQRRAALADDGAVALRKPGDEVVDARLPRRRLHRGVRGVRARVAQVLGQRGMEDERRVLHQGDVPAQERQRQRPQVAAVQPDRAPVRIEEPQQQVGHGRLPHPAAADDGHRLPRRGGERHLLQRRRAAVERKAHPVELHHAVNVRGRRRARPFLHLDRGIRDLVHARQRDPGRGEARVEPHQRLHRRQQPGLVGHERDQRAHAEGAVEIAEPAVEERRAHAAGQQHAGQAAGQVGHPLHRHQRADERPVPVAEPGHLAPLRVGGDHQLHGRERLDEKAPDVGAPLAERGDAALEPAAVDHQRPDAQRQHGHAGQEQPRVEPEHHGGRPGQEQQVADPRERGLGRHALDLADVVVEARHDVAQPRAGVEAGRKLLQAAVQVQPHVEQDLRRHAGVAQAAGDVQQETEDGQADEGRDDAHEHRPVAGEQRVVDQVAGQQRHDQRRRRAGETERHHQGEAPPVRRDVGQRAPEPRIEHAGPSLEKLPGPGGVRAPAAASRRAPTSCRRRAPACSGSRTTRRRRSRWCCRPTRCKAPARWC